MEHYVKRNLLLCNTNCWIGPLHCQSPMTSAAQIFTPPGLDQKKKSGSQNNCIYIPIILLTWNQVEKKVTF